MTRVSEIVGNPPTPQEKEVPPDEVQEEEDSQEATQEEDPPATPTAPTGAAAIIAPAVPQHPELPTTKEVPWSGKLKRSASPNLLPRPPS